jgi:hypothetical protein
MGHSSINVSLTYLRGLEIAELKEEDMPLMKNPYSLSKGFKSIQLIRFNSLVT